MPSSDYLIELGRYLERVNTHSEQIAEHESRIGKIEIEIGTAKAWLGRAATAGGLWAGGLALNLPAEQIGQLFAKIVRATH